MIFIANKQNQVTARRIDNQKPEGRETKNIFYVALYEIQGFSWSYMGFYVE